ncbi:MAG: hypothetical protein AAGA96_04795 [Verrucomicrobiota bacterium]
MSLTFITMKKLILVWVVVSALGVLANRALAQESDAKWFKSTSHMVGDLKKLRVAPAIVNGNGKRMESSAETDAFVSLLEDLGHQVELTEDPSGRIITLSIRYAVVGDLFAVAAEIEQTEDIHVQREGDTYIGPAVTWQNKQVALSDTENLGATLQNLLATMTRRLSDAIAQGGKEF